jgi:FMN reductase [NAD(P)H]
MGIKPSIHNSHYLHIITHSIFLEKRLIDLDENTNLMSFPKDIFTRMFSESPGLLYPKHEEVEEGNIQDLGEVLETNIFNVMLSRRSQRKFEKREVEDWKLEMIFAAADTAPTAGGFQGFEIYHVKNEQIKLKLVTAANNQPYVAAPVVLVFFMNPSRVKMNFPTEIIMKFSQQDATLAAAYSQLAAHALGLSTIWIGMINEAKVMEAIQADLVPSSILCIGYPLKMLQPKPKRNLKDLIHVLN